MITVTELKGVFPNTLQAFEKFTEFHTSPIKINDSSIYYMLCK